jgi:hypothetical protein
MQRVARHDLTLWQPTYACCCYAVAPGACFLGSTNLLNIAMAFGFSIFVLVYAAASFSGGHMLSDSGECGTGTTISNT